MTEPPATPEEQQEAEALAAALDSTGPDSLSSAPLTDALQTAALLRDGRRDDELSAKQREAIWSQLAPAVATRARRRTSLRRKWLMTSIAAAAAVAIALSSGLWVRTQGSHLPAPDPALIEAQLRVIRRDPGGLTALETQMNGYRRKVFATLADRYARTP